MKYDAYTYLYPPRPENKIPSGMLPAYEKMGYWSQVKKNGTCTVIFARGLDVKFMKRNGPDADHNQWSPKPEHIRFFQSANLKWNVFVAELLHSKTTHIKDELYIFDQIVEDGVHLVGTSFEERQLMLQARWTGTDEYDQTRINKNITVAKSFGGNFRDLWKTVIEKPENEGLVLKNPKGILQPCFKQTANNNWQVKCRKPHKNYSF